MSLTRLAVNRPITTLMASLLVMIIGGVALSRLAVDLMPDITYPTVSITTIYEGAGPDEIETLITRPMEQAAGSVQGAEQILSSSMEGSSTVRVRFAWGTDVDSAISDIRARIERLRPTLPEQILPPSIRRYDIADFPVIYLGLQSELDDVRLTQMAEKVITPQLENINGVASVRIRGGSRREIQVDVNRAKLESLNLSVADVVGAVKTASVNQPAGDFKQGHMKLLVRSRGDFLDLDQIRNTVVREQNDAVVRIRDVATVVDGIEEQTERTRVNGKPGLLIYIHKQSGANTVAVSDRVHRRVERLNRALPNARLSVRIDKADFIRQSIDNVKSAILLGMLLACIVLLVFLRSVLSTVIIAVAMPLSVLATFILIYFKGFTLNVVSFGGLALGIGMLVDNSIVVLESIFLRREDGDDPQTAAIEGTREVSSAIIASTLTTLIVFLPLLFIQGTTGILLHQLTWVVSISLVCSLFASLTLTPVMTAYLIPADRRPRWAIGRKLYGVTRFFDTGGRKVFGWVENGYRGVLRFCFRHATAVGLVLFACFCGSLGLIPRVGTEFLPKTDEGDLRLTGNMAAGIQLEQLDAQTRLLENAVFKNVDESRTMAVNIGGDVDRADDWNEVWIRVHLVPRSERRRSAEAIRRELAARIGPVAGMKVRVQVRDDQMLSRVLSSTRDAGDVVVEVRGYDLATAEQLADVVQRKMHGIRGLVNVQIGNRDRRPEVSARIDRIKAGLLGVNVQNISQTLETTVRGTEATVFREEGNEYKVRVRLRENDRNRVDDIEHVGVTAQKGLIIPLKSVVDFNHGEAPVTIARLDQQRVLQVTGDVDGRDLGSVVGDLQAELDGIRLPAGFSLNIAGQWEEQQRAFADLKMGFVLAVVLMYMVMASQFESLKDPLVILIALPFGAVGVIAVLVFTDTTLNVQSFIGIVMLSGIVVNNAIVLVDYVNQLRHRHPELASDEIATRAGVRRLRPILMTTLTTVLAMIPIALGWGEGGELQAPMARVVIAGLVSGTLMTLLAIPLICHAMAPRTAAEPVANEIV
jgi:hydrophobic/amphiphilic exporter-1 (mainly G- bacteria), HAE1 family